MVNIYIVAEAALATTVRQILGSGYRVVAVTPDIRVVLTYRYEGNSDVLIIDDILLREAPGLVEYVARLACPKILVGSMRDVAAARRAIALKVLDIIEPAHLHTALPAILETVEGTSEVDAPPGRVISLFSSKGGVGKSTIALNLAWALARQSAFPVALIDFDALGDIATMLPRVPGVSLVDVVESIEAGLSQDAIASSLHVVTDIDLTIIGADPNPQRSQQVAAAHVPQIIDLVAPASGYVIIDMGTGINDINLAVLDRSDEILVVTAPEKVTLLPLARSLPVLGRLYHDRMSLIINRFGSDTGLAVDEITAMIGQPTKFVLRSGGAAPVKASNQGKPLILADPQNVLAHDILAMAHSIVVDNEGSRRIAPKTGTAGKL